MTNANCGSLGPGMSNSLGMNASSPMHGQGPGQTMSMGRTPGPPGSRVYMSGGNSMAPTSPSMPQSAGPGMGPPAGNVNRKAMDGLMATVHPAGNSAQAR